MVDDLLDLTQEPSTSILSDEDTEFTNRSKARFRRRLQDRWACKMPGSPAHIYCFANPDGAHVPLNENAMEIWVSALHNGEATLLIPPNGLIPWNKPRSTSSDAVSIVSLASRSTIQYQCPFRLQGNPSLTDLRSMQVKLRESMAFSSNSTVSYSTASSGVPGIGYLSGKGIKWVGLKILDAIAEVELRRRRRMIPRLVNRIANMPADQRTEWLVKNESQINRTIGDILELSLNYYKADYRTTAIELGSKIRDLIVESDTGNGNFGQQLAVNAMRIKTLPLQLLVDEHAASQDFADSLRETLLQDSSWPVEEKDLVAELTAQICYELAYATSSPWHYQGYKTLWALYHTVTGQHCLRSLVQNGDLIKDLAGRAFKTAAGSTTEHARAIDFFVMLADDVPEFRTDILAANGVPLLIHNFKGLGTANSSIPMLDLCGALANISCYPWCLSSVALDVCPTLINLLIISQNNSNQLGDPLGRAWGCELIIRFLSHLATYKIEGRQAIHDATTDELGPVLTIIEANLRRQRGDAAARRTRDRIRIIWP